jgi:hypothetical protein
MILETASAHQVGGIGLSSSIPGLGDPLRPEPPVDRYEASSTRARDRHNTALYMEHI